MLNVLIVEDEPIVASTLASLIKLEEGFHVAGFAEDVETSLATLRADNVHIAFIDIQLERLDSGFRVADELKRRGISCVLVTGALPPFPMPELAVGCIEKPFTPATVAGALRLAAADLYAQPSLPLPLI